MKKTETNDAPSKCRVYWLDCARALAIISITINHSMSRCFATDVNTLAEFQSMNMFASFIKATLYVFSRLGVPLFLMITGVLLLPRDYEDKTITSRFIRHNWLALLRTTEIWLTIMYLYLCIGTKTMRALIGTYGISYAIKNWIETSLFINQTTMNSMWYMAMILVVYLMIPVFSISVKRMGDKYIFVLCIVVIVLSMIIPNLNILFKALGCGYSMKLSLSDSNLFTYYIVYILIGYWIGRGIIQEIQDNILSALLLCFFIVTLGFQFFIYSRPIDYTIRYADVGILLTSAALFEFIRRKANNVIGLRKGIEFLSKISFGIYFVHICIMTGITVVFERVTINPFIKFGIMEIGAFIGSVLIIASLSKSSIAKKYLFLIKD